MRKSLILAGASVALFIGGTSVFAHGGRYVGPGDRIPPGRGSAGDTRPPGGIRGPGSPGTTSGPMTGGRQPGRTGGPGMGAVGAGGAISGRRGGGSAGFDQWEFWWALNKEPYLNLKDRLKANGVTSGSAGLATGRGRQAGLSQARVSQSDFQQLILPTLLALLEKEKDADIVDSAVLAIARSLDANSADLANAAVLRALRNDHDSAKEAATLALGVLGSPQARSTLRDLLNDTLEGRRSLGDTKPVSALIRGFAAISLGLIQDPADIEILKSAIDNEPDSQRDLKSSALLALGMFTDHSDRVAPYLMDVMGRSQMDQIVRSLAPIALSRLNRDDVAPAAVPQIIQALKSDRTDNAMIRSCVIALGKLGSLTDPETKPMLLSVIRNQKDQQSQHFAFIALAEVAERSAKTEESKKSHESLQRFFLSELTQPKRSTHQPWAAIALAHYGRHHSDNTKLVTLAKTKLLEAFEDVKNPSYRGAIAISLGILNARHAGPRLHKAMLETHDQEFGGYLATALGMIHYREAAEDMRSMITRKGLDFRFRLNLARALGLLQDAESLDILTAWLAKAKTLTETASMAQAIGLIGDSRAIEPLILLAEDPKERAVVRGFAAVSLGLLAEKSVYPWNADLGIGLNYRSKTPAISEILDIL